MELDSPVVEPDEAELLAACDALEALAGVEEALFEDAAEEELLVEDATEEVSTFEAVEEDSLVGADAAALEVSVEVAGVEVVPP